MSTTAAEVVSPVPADADGLANVLSFIQAHEARPGTSPEPAFFLSGAGEHDRVELTEQLHEILKRVVHALSHGQSVSILTRDQEISTQQAAELLGLSRPTVVRLIADGELHAHVPGAVRRKLRLADVLAYREELRARRNRFITESSAEFADADADADADEVTELLAEAKRKR
ncbi:helix-turn-helix domain-containing protein [Candidatus Mycolicibacterium alkanivorans]|uniref:Helix-turn-helix domain-containing protein n=1 Tax=Candidatus Mycolicibacterium alkanivorans TaxID=2954114 RepID=A0ABS9YTN5_9MYCO|nr:helix-turn-helix domain-containing protein [Candidatus Mycolicibacterium alkanivorans]MCI4674593.1 helix-turn-helix domain-containing protein [Candidatus Mycolicibacterium alkanivorans]